MELRASLTRGVGTGLRLGRGTADRAVRLTRHLLASRRTPPAATPETFAPSKRVADPVTEPVIEPATGPTTPNPAVVARNIAPQRPTARPPAASRPRSVPGAKLPPPRSSAS